MEYNTILILAILVTLVIVLIRTLNIKQADPTSQLMDLKNELNEMKNKQLEMQNQSILRQQELLSETQDQMNKQLNEIIKIVNDNLTQNHKNIYSQLSNTTTLIGEVQQKLGVLETTAKNMQDIGKDISSLQDILKAPKLRGNLGEFMLEELLRQIFPSEYYTMQYSFQNGRAVDAVLRIGDKLVPIDAKFPLEKFVKMIHEPSETEKQKIRNQFLSDVKKRIDEIATRYIKTDEGTYDFALMYIPAENVYYEIMLTHSSTGNDEPILNYAMQKHVIPVSPNSFYAYLMAIAYGLKGFQIERRAKTLIGELTGLQHAFTGFYEQFEVVGKHLNNASNKYSESVKLANILNNKISQITHLPKEVNEIDSHRQIEGN